MGQHGIELSFTNGTEWKVLKDTGNDEIYALAWGPLRKLTKRVMYWGDAYQEGGAQNTVVKCSRDGGATVYSTWDLGYVSGARDEIAVLATSKLSPSTAYLAFNKWDDAVYKTTDYGKNWAITTRTGMGRPPIALAVHPSDPNTVVIGYPDNYGAGMFCYSSNGGTTWTNSPIASNYRAAGATITSGGTMLGCGGWVNSGWGCGIWNIATGALIFDGDNHQGGGYNDLSLKAIDSALVGGTRVLSAHYPKVKGGLVLSKTKGTAFTDIYNVSLPTPGYTDDFTTVALSKSGLLAYMSIESSGVWFSDDGCATWTKIYTFTDVGDYRVRGVVISDPVEENWVWMLAGLDAINGSLTPGENPKQIWFSEDKGETWEGMRDLVVPANYTAFNSQFALGYDKTVTAPLQGGV